jgi:hypothetical protein
MKTYFLVAIIGCALTCGVSYAGPPGNGVAPKEQAPTHPASSEQAKPPLKNAPRPASGAAVSGGPANLVKAAPSITGTVNPAKNTAAVSGTGMKHKP